MYRKIFFLAALAFCLSAIFLWAMTLNQEENHSKIRKFLVAELHQELERTSATHSTSHVENNNDFTQNTLQVSSD